jgi:hypothetical protein
MAGGGGSEGVACGLSWFLVINTCASLIIIDFADSYEPLHQLSIASLIIIDFAGS